MSRSRCVDDIGIVADIVYHSGVGRRIVSTFVKSFPVENQLIMMRSLIAGHNVIRNSNNVIHN